MCTPRMEGTNSGGFVRALLGRLAHGILKGDILNGGHVASYAAAYFHTKGPFSVLFYKEFHRETSVQTAPLAANYCFEIAGFRVWWLKAPVKVSGEL